MSRTEFFAASDPARAEQSFRDGATAPPIVAPAALALLPALHHEAGRDLYLWRQLASTPQFCIALMLESALVLAWVARAGLTAEFAWAAGVFLGIAALARNHIRGFACSPRKMAVTQAVRELRAILFFLGVAWGFGAFLVLPRASTLLLIFVAAPSLAAAATLKDELSVLVFGMAAALLTAGAVLVAQPVSVAGITLLAGVSIAGLSMLQCANRRKRDLH